MSEQHSHKEYQGDAEEAGQNEPISDELAALEQALREKMERGNILTGLFPSPLDKDRRIEALEEALRRANESQARNYHETQVLIHVAHAHGLIEACGESDESRVTNAVFREVLLAIEYLNDRD